MGGIGHENQPRLDRPSSNSGSFSNQPRGGGFESSNNRSMSGGRGGFSAQPNMRANKPPGEFE